MATHRTDGRTHRRTDSNGRELRPIELGLYLRQRAAAPAARGSVKDRVGPRESVPQRTETRLFTGCLIEWSAGRPCALIAVRRRRRLHNVVCQSVSRRSGLARTAQRRRRMRTAASNVARHVITPIQLSHIRPWRISTPSTSWRHSWFHAMTVADTTNDSPRKTRVTAAAAAASSHRFSS